ncbi:hypothetical protein Tco_0071488 [Tanacetum coccineum]
MNMGPNRQMQMNVRNQVVQNLGVQNVGNQNRLIVVPGIANQNPNGNGNVVAEQGEGNSNGNNGNQIRCYNCQGLGHLARNYTVRPRRRDDAYLQTQLLIAQKEKAGIQLQAEKFDLMAAIANLDEIKEVNANCILMANLQQASTSGTQTDNAPVYESNGSAENDSNVIHAVFSVEQDEGTVEQHPAAIEKTQAAKFVRDFQSLAKEADESLAKHKALELEIECLLRAVISQDIMSIVQTPTVVDTSYLQTELDRTKEQFENCFLRAQLFDKVSEQKDTTKGTSANTKFANQKNLELLFLQPPRNHFVVRPPNVFQSERPKRVPPKVGMSNDLSNPVTSNSVPTTRESKVVENDKVITPGMFRIDPCTTSREDNFVPNKHVKASVRTKPITVSQPHVITKKHVNSDSNGFSFT